MDPNSHLFDTSGGYPYPNQQQQPVSSRSSHRQGHPGQPYPTTSQSHPRSPPLYVASGMPHPSGYNPQAQPEYYNAPNVYNSASYPSAATYGNNPHSQAYPASPTSPTRPTVHHRPRTSSSSPFTTQPMTSSNMSMSASPPQSPGRTSTSSKTSPSQEKFICDLCHQSFSRAYDRKRHQAKHASTRPEFQCPGCKQVYSRADSLKRHTDSGCPGLA